MTAASSTAAGLPAAPVAASAGGPLPPGSASVLVFAEVMVEAMACAPAEGALALDITGETGCEKVGACAPRQPPNSNRLRSPVASEGGEATSAATLEALAQSMASQLRSPVVLVPSSATPAEGEAGHVQKATEVAPQPAPLPTLKQPSAIERAEAVSSSQVPVKSAQSGATIDSTDGAAGRLRPGRDIANSASLHVPAAPLPTTAVPPRPSGIATQSGGEENTSGNADGLASLAEVMGTIPPPPLNSSGQLDAPAGPVTRGNFPAEPPSRPPAEEQSAPVRRPQHPDEAKPSAPDVPVVLVKHPDESALATLNTPKKAVAKVSPGEARGPEGRAERAPFPLAGEPAAEAGTFTTQPAVADRENHFLPVRPVHSAAEARFAPPPPSDSAAPAAVPLPFRAGTGTAELGDGMKNATEPKQIAGPAQQNLPEPGVASHAMVPEWSRRGGVRSLPAVAATEARSEGATPLILLWSPDQSKVRAAEEVIAQPAAVAPGSPSPMEPLQSSVLRHITELRHTGATEMAVVLKPDAETQLALRLTMGSNGEVTVQARCEHGDTQALAANWGEIRHSLAQQGVRLGALEFSPERRHDPFQPHAGNGGPSPDGQPSSQRHGQPWPETLDDLPLTGSLTEPLTRRGVPRPPAGRTRLLESWA